MSDLVLVITFPVDEKYYNQIRTSRSLVHCWATDKDDPTVQPRWGKVGKQKIVDEGTLAPFPDMSNVPNMHELPFLKKAKYQHDDLRRGAGPKASSDFMDKAIERR